MYKLQFVTHSEFHTNEKFVKIAKQLEEMGADSICIKDMARSLRPYVTYDLVKMMKERVKILFNFILTTQACGFNGLPKKAIEAGVDVIDCAMSGGYGYIGRLQSL